MEEYPSTAYVLTLVGAILSLLFGVVYLLMGVALVGSFGAYDPLGALAGGAICIVIVFLGAILGFLAASMMKNPEKAHSGGIIAIIPHSSQLVV